MTSEFTNRKAAKRPKPGPPADLSKLGLPRARKVILHAYNTFGRNSIASFDLIIQIRLCKSATNSMHFCDANFSVVRNEIFIALLVNSCLDFDPSTGVAPLSVG